MYDVVVPIDLVFVYETQKNASNPARSNVAVGGAVAAPLVTLPVMQAVSYVVEGTGEVTSYYQ